MKKAFIFLVAFFALKIGFGQNVSKTEMVDYQRPNVNAENQLNNLIIRTLQECFNQNIYTYKYLNTKWIPYDFPYDSLKLTPFKEDCSSCNSEATLKEMKQKGGINVINVYYEFLDDCLVIFVGESNIRMPRKKRIEIGRGHGGRCSIFKFSCEEQQWQYVESLWSNKLPSLDNHTGISVYRFVEQMPEYKNGDNDFWEDFYNYFQYDTTGDKSYRIQIKTKFVINTQGELIGARIVDNQWNEKPSTELSDLEQAVLDALGHLQGWTPGKQNGKTVNILIYKGVSIGFGNNK
jgi:hypothetical protein